MMALFKVTKLLGHDGNSQ